MSSEKEDMVHIGKVHQLLIELSFLRQSDSSLIDLSCDEVVVSSAAVTTVPLEEEYYNPCGACYEEDDEEDYYRRHQWRDQWIEEDEDKEGYFYDRMEIHELDVPEVVPDVPEVVPVVPEVVPDVPEVVPVVPEEVPVVPEVVPVVPEEVPVVPEEVPVVPEVVPVVPEVVPVVPEEVPVVPEVVPVVPEVVPVVPEEVPVVPEEVQAVLEERDIEEEEIQYIRENQARLFDLFEQERQETRRLHSINRLRQQEEMAQSIISSDQREYIREIFLLQQEERIRKEQLKQERLRKPYKIKDVTVFIRNSPSNFKESCPICLNKRASYHMTTECGHTFCRNCITNTIQKVSDKCPLCRDKMKYIYQKKRY